MISISILDEFQKKDIKLDSKQLEFLNLVDASIKEDKKILSFLRSQKIPSIYLYGGVGIGKTILLKSIASNLNHEFKFIHFTNFMNLIKKKLDKFDGQKNPLDKAIDALKDQNPNQSTDRSSKLDADAEAILSHLKAIEQIVLKKTENTQIPVVKRPVQRLEQNARRRFNRR